MKKDQNQTQGEPVYYSVQQVADHFGVSASTVRNWIKAGIINAVRVGKIIRIPAAELDRISGNTAAE